jgi:hypothetical protein
LVVGNNIHIFHENMWSLKITAIPKKVGIAVCIYFGQIGFIWTNKKWLLSI